MPKFNKNSSRELKDYLYNNCFHDAKLQNIEYKSTKDTLKIELLNPFFNKKLVLTFHDIEIFLAMKGNWHGSSEEVSSLTLEEDFSYLKTYMLNQSECINSDLYLLFQMFSGDEWHIVSKEVIIEIE